MTPLNEPLLMNLSNSISSYAFTLHIMLCLCFKVHRLTVLSHKRCLKGSMRVLVCILYSKVSPDGQQDTSISWGVMEILRTHGTKWVVHLLRFLASRLCINTKRSTYIIWSFSLVGSNSKVCQVLSSFSFLGILEFHTTSVPSICNKNDSLRSSKHSTWLIRA